MTDKQKVKNRWFFGIGTIGRDMLYTMVSMFLLNYGKNVLELDGIEFAVYGGILTAVSIIDAFNDPFMGAVVDSSESKWGKFKPWIVGGGVTYSLLTILMFALAFFLNGVAFLVVFAAIYLIQEIAYTTNDIGYWSMLPELSKDPREKDLITSRARIFANIGLFIAVAGIPMLAAEDGTGLLTEALGGDAKLAFFIITVGVAVILNLLQMFTVKGVRVEDADLTLRYPEDNRTDKNNKKIISFKKRSEGSPTIKDIFRIIFKNKQLLIVTITMTLFMTGYNIIALNGIDYFQYVFGDKSMYSYFAIVLGVSQILGLIMFPFIRKKLTKKQIYLLGMGLMTVGFIVFFFMPANFLAIVGPAVLMFVGQSFLQALMLIFITDCVEYGEYQFGKRNESITFAAQPIIYKLSNAFAKLSYTITFLLPVLSNLVGENAVPITEEGIFTLKFVMLIIPAILIVISAVVFFFNYKIDDKMYDEILEVNKKRREEQKLNAAKQD